MLYFQKGTCNLAEFIKEYCKSGQYFHNNLETLIYIIITIFDHIEVLKEAEIYHSDIKSHNIIFIYDIQSDTYKLKLIDFGSSAMHHKALFGYTPFYFCNDSTRREGIKYNDFFESPKDRLRAELY